MELTNDFTINAPFERAWAVLTDVERIAPCMPGAQLKEVRGDDFLGTVKVKVGPITAEYQGTASWVEREMDAGRAVLRAQGRETRGQGNASATVTATLQADGSATKVSVLTDLSITGRVAQFGRGVLVDVSTKLLGQFVAALEADVLSTGDAVADERTVGGDEQGLEDVNQERSAVPKGASMDNGRAGLSAPSAPSFAGRQPTGSRMIESPEAEPIDLLDLAGGSVARRVVPTIIGAVLALAFWCWVRRRRRSG